MNEKTLAALKGSIEKWEKIVAGTGLDDGTENCPLCALFNNANTYPICVGCPVMERAGMDGCEGTPYQDWCDEHLDYLPYAATTDTEKTAAKNELEFLRSLLPPGACD